MILESNVAHNITRLSDSFSTVPPIINGGDLGSIVRDLETIIAWCYSHSHLFHKGYHSLTLPRSRIKDSATVTLTPGDGTTAIKVESMQKAPKCTGGTITGPEHFPAALLIQRQPVYSDNYPP